MGLPESPQEILVSTIDYYHCSDGGIDYIHTGVCSSSVYLFNFLEMSLAIKRRRCKHILYFALLCVWLELLALAFFKTLNHRLQPIIYIPKNINADSVRNNLSDPLGWGSSKITESSEALPSKCRILMYGDSFTEAKTYSALNEKGLSLTPENYLFKYSGCKVVNYGVGGYGSDQAYLKFRQHLENGIIRCGDIVVLNHLSENILRNSNRNRSNLYPSPGGESALLLKPTISFEKDGSMKVNSLPKIISASELSSIKDTGVSTATLNGEDLRFVPNRYFFGSTIIPSFPYSISLMRTLFHWHVYPRFFLRPRHAPFYAHYSNSLYNLSSLVTRFHDDCLSVGCISVSTDLPVADDFKEINAYGSASSYNLLVSLPKKYQHMHISITKAMYMNNPSLRQNHCFLHDGTNDGGGPCNAHFNQNGYKQFLRLLSRKATSLAKETLENPTHLCENRSVIASMD